MADLASRGPNRVLTNTHLMQNKTPGGVSNIAKVRLYHTRFASKQRDLQGQQNKSSSKSEKGITRSVKKSSRYKIGKRRKHDSRAKDFPGRHRITCAACRSYGTLIECDTCTSSWHSQCVRVGTVPDPASPPAYWSCPKCLEKRTRTIDRLPKESEHTFQGGSKINSVLLPSIDLHNDDEPHNTIHGLQEVQQCCLELSTAAKQGVENSQSTIQVLQEALNANASEVAALKLEAHHRSRELEEARTEKERVTAKLNQKKAGNSESTSKMASIMKIVEGFFIHRHDE